MAEKRIDEFALVLIAGLILIATVVIYYQSFQLNETNVTTKVKLGKVKMFQLGDLVVEYEIGMETLVEQKNYEIKSGIFADRNLIQSFSLTSEKLASLNEGFIELEIISTNKLSPLMVLLNGKPIYKGIPQAKLFLTLEKSVFKEGENILEIKAEIPKTWKFWKSSYYLINLEVGISYFGQSFRDFVFELEKEDVRDFDHAYLQFYVNEDESAMEGNLIIKINGGEFFRGKPELFFNRTIDRPIFRAKPLKNRISFSVDPNSKYVLENVMFAIIKK